MNGIAGRIFDLKSVNFKAVAGYGFRSEGEGWVLSRPMLGGQMVCVVRIDCGGTPSAEVIDAETGDEYTLHLVEGSEGQFVGRVREEYTSILEDISRNCFYTRIFKGRGMAFAEQYVRGKYGDSLQFLWSDLPDCAVLRRSDNKKWYAVFMRVKRSKIIGCGGDPQEKVEIIDVRAPIEQTSSPDLKVTFPAYHMNKKNWLTVMPDGAAEDEIAQFIDVSYAIAAKKG